MTRSFKQGCGLVLAVVVLAACNSAPTSMTQTTTVPPTPMVIVAASTATSTPVLPTATATPVATDPPPTATASPAEEVETNTNQDDSDVTEDARMNIQIGDRILTATLAENSSVDALKAALAQAPITIDMRDYGSMEKVGSLGMDLPRNDEQITTEAGDIILYQGNAFVIYYAPNSWSFTRLGKVDNLTEQELREILGGGNVTITLSLAQE